MLSAERILEVPPNLQRQELDARNNLIDGWRGLSVLLVVLGHLVAYRFAIPAVGPLHELGISKELFTGLMSRIVGPIGEIGVQIFFVISGFLITSLLIKEEECNSNISILGFYVRRVFRIIPAFSVYLLVLMFLKSANLIEIDSSAFWRSALFTCDFSDFKCTWWLGHTWSLSVEEQFYLVWPWLFIVLKRGRVAAAAIACVVFVAASLRYPQMNAFAHIAAGALVASSSVLQNVLARFAGGWCIVLAAIALLLRPLLPVWTEVTALAPLLTAIVFFGTIFKNGPLVALVDLRFFQKIGIVSYSIYLWQQVGTAPAVWNGTITGAGVLYADFGSLTAFFIIPAIASYLLVERSFIAFGKRLSAVILGSRLRREQAVPSSLTAPRIRVESGAISTDGG